MEIKDKSINTIIIYIIIKSKEGKSWQKSKELTEEPDLNLDTKNKEIKKEEE